MFSYVNSWLDSVGSFIFVEKKEIREKSQGCQANKNSLITQKTSCGKVFPNNPKVYQKLATSDKARSSTNTVVTNVTQSLILCHFLTLLPVLTKFL